METGSKNGERRRRARLDFSGVIGYTLQIGVLMSVALIMAGYAWRWFNTGHLQMDYSIPASNLYDFWVNGLKAAGSGGWRPRLLVNLGIALLMATPYFRVLVSVFYFAFVERNLKYTAFTLVVFSVLTFSLFIRVEM